MRPVHHTALSVPRILAVETYVISYPYPVHSRSQVYVVGNQKCLLRWESNDESLVLRSVKVIRQNARHHTFAFNLYLADAGFESASDRIISSRNAALVRGPDRVATP